jgi:hypothetical protein
MQIYTGLSAFVVVTVVVFVFVVAAVTTMDELLNALNHN